MMGRDVPVTPGSENGGKQRDRKNGTRIFDATTLGRNGPFPSPWDSWVLWTFAAVRNMENGMSFPQREHRATEQHFGRPSDAP